MQQADRDDVLQVCTPKQVYEQPASVAVADFVGRCSFFDTRVLDGDVDDHLLVELAARRFGCVAARSGPRAPR